jgi:hypothetical protein
MVATDSRGLHFPVLVSSGEWWPQAQEEPRMCSYDSSQQLSYLPSCAYFTEVKWPQPPWRGGSTQQPPSSQPTEHTKTILEQRAWLAEGLRTLFSLGHDNVALVLASSCRSDMYECIPGSWEQDIQGAWKKWQRRIEIPLKVTSFEFSEFWTNQSEQKLVGELGEGSAMARTWQDIPIISNTIQNYIQQGLPDVLTVPNILSHSGQPAAARQLISYCSLILSLLLLLGLYAISLLFDSLYSFHMLSVLRSLSLNVKLLACYLHMLFI